MHGFTFPRRVPASRFGKLGFGVRHPFALWRARAHLKRVQQQLARYDVRRVLNLPVKNLVNIAPEQSELLYRLAAKTLRQCHCLPQSVAVFQHLKAHGIPARHVIGVNKTHRHGQSLKAHAWVEKTTPDHRG